MNFVNNIWVSFLKSNAPQANTACPAAYLYLVLGPSWNMTKKGKNEFLTKNGTKLVGKWLWQSFFSDYSQTSEIPNVQYYTFINNFCAIMGIALYLPLWLYERSEKDTNVGTKDTGKIVTSFYEKEWMYSKSFQRYIFALAGIFLMQIVTLATLGLNIYLNFCSS